MKKSTCPFCKKKLNNSNHIYHCENNKSIYDKSKIKYNFYIYNYKIAEKELLRKEYIVNELSYTDIKNKYNIDLKSISWLLEYHQIPKRNLKDAYKLGAIKTKYFYNKNYGVDNCSQLDTIKEKKKKTFIKNYGVDNIFKNELFKDWISENNFAWNLTKIDIEKRIEKQKKSILNFWNDKNNEDYINKIKNNNKKKYQNFIESLSDNELSIYNKKKGEWWYKLSDEQKSEFFKKRYRFSSSIETTISNTLSLLGIEHSRQKRINKYFYDIHITNTKILIEVNGDYWHCNPLFYKKDDYVKFPLKEIKCNEIWEKDKLKNNIAKDKGYVIIYIWEYDIKNSNNLKELVLNKLLEIKHLK
jgi:G:T-mismatch repair DNA endonuclease (very short patch repair protein)